MVEGTTFYLGERSEYSGTDFDGRVRTCRVLGALKAETDGGEGTRYLRVTVEPPLPVGDGRSVRELVLTERDAGDDLLKLADESPSVYVFEITDDAGLAHGRVAADSLRFYAWADIARLPTLLPPSPEERFDRLFVLLQRFVERVGHADMPGDHFEDGLPLGNWVRNLRFSRAYGDLDPAQAQRLEALPGWWWLSGDDYHLLRNFAAREGHTEVPLDHFEEGRPLGWWVADLRSNHAHGGFKALTLETEERLEAIPHWHW